MLTGWNVVVMRDIYINVYVYVYIYMCVYIFWVMHGGLADLSFLASLKYSKAVNQVMVNILFAPDI